jgi:hypothetical protein
MTDPSPDPVHHAYEMRPPFERRNRIQFDQARRIVTGIILAGPLRMRLSGGS